MDRKIKQLKSSEVLGAIVDNKRVIRINLDTETACDLLNRSINLIKRELEKDCFVYIVEEGENE